MVKDKEKPINVTMPGGLMAALAAYLKTDDAAKHGFTSMRQVIIHLLRDYLVREEYALGIRAMNKAQIFFKSFEEDMVTLMDTNIKSNIFLKSDDNGFFCNHCKTTNCKHIVFFLQNYEWVLKHKSLFQQSITEFL